MADPTYTPALKVGTLGTISNLLTREMTFSRCSRCASLTDNTAAHTAWHNDQDATITAAAKAAADAATAASQARTAASDAATAAGKAQTTANGAQTAAQGAQSTANAAGAAAGAAQTRADSAYTHASDAMTAANTADTTVVGVSTTAAEALDTAIRALTNMCPVCKLRVRAFNMAAHLAFHESRSMSDPVETPAAVKNAAAGGATV